MRNNNRAIQVGGISAGVFPVRSTRFSVSPAVHAAMQYLIAKVLPPRTLYRGARVMKCTLMRAVSL